MLSKSSKKLFLFLSILLTLAVAQSLNAYAASKLTGKAKILIASYDNNNVPGVASMFRRAGADVTTTTRQASDINPKNFDGLVIPGATPDIWPGYYGQGMAGAKNCNKSFDKYRFKMIKKFILKGKPVFGICGGLQSINVLCGGDLIQHIDGHRGVRHNVKILKNSPNYSLFGKKVSVYHSHHQCVGKVAPGFVVTELDKKDNHIEAIKHTRYPIYGVQYHPECMGNNGLLMAKAYVQVCLNYRKNSVIPNASEFAFINWK